MEIRSVLDLKEIKSSVLFTIDGKFYFLQTGEAAVQLKTLLKLTQAYKCAVTGWLIKPLEIAAQDRSGVVRQSVALIRFFNRDRTSGKEVYFAPENVDQLNEHWVEFIGRYKGAVTWDVNPSLYEEFPVAEINRLKDVFIDHFETSLSKRTTVH